MNDLIKQVTPLTRAVIWTIKGECDVTHPHYIEIDYLLDGLLTANFNASKELTSRVIVGKNFNKPLFVMIIQDIKPLEVQSFVTLIKNDLGPENDILVIDETGGIDKLKSELKTVSANIRILS